MDLLTRLDCAIKKAWKEDIQRDYFNDHFFKEDSLKRRLCSYIEKRLGGDGVLIRNCIRVLPEYALPNGQRVDIAVVRLKPRREVGYSYYAKDRMKEILAIIECKYLTTERMDAFVSDALKVRDLSRKPSYGECQFYLAGIQEGFRPSTRVGVLKPRQQGSWAQGRVTELVGCWTEEDDEMVFEVLPHNGLNSRIRYRRTV